MSIGGAQVSFGVGLQADKTTVATNNYLMKLDETDETPGRLEDRGRPEIGGSLATGFTVDVFGARPVFSGRGKFRIGTSGLLLAGVGYGSVTAAGTPAVISFGQVTTGADWPYLTIPYHYDDADAQFRLTAARVTNLDIEFVSGREPIITFNGQARGHEESDSTVMAEIADYMPNPAVTINAAQRVILGAATAVIFSLGFNVAAIHDTENQPIGDILSDDVVPTQYVTSIRTTMRMASTTYRSLVYGSATGTSVSPVLASGTLLYRINTADPVSGATVGYFEVFAPSVKYTQAGRQRTLPNQQVLVPVLAVPTAAVTVRYLNGASGTAYGA